MSLGSRSRSSLVVFLIVVVGVFTHCGSSGSPPATNTNNTNGSQPPTLSPAATHVVIVVLENESYSEVIGNSLMPVFNSMAAQNALATQFFANTHPSIGNYFMMTAGQIVTNDDAFTGIFSGDNVARQITAAGKTWKVYAESLPSAGYLGDDVVPYVKHHNPFAYFDDVINSPAQSADIVPFSQFAADVSGNSLPNYSFVIPDDVNDGHTCADGTQNCPLSAKQSLIDAWLSANIAPLLQNPSFMQSSILIVTFDESDGTDITNGGGNIPLIVAGGSIKTGYQSTTMYQFPSLLRFTMNSIGVSNVPGEGASAQPMSEFLK